MSWLEQFHMANPEYLILVPVILVALVIGWRRRVPTVLLPTLRPLQEAREARGGGWLLRLPLLIETLALLCFVVAMSRPQYGIEEMHDITEGVDILLAIDISGSMQAVDITPGAQPDLKQQRLEIAKREVTTFIEKRPSDRIGLVAFSGRTYTMCPPTLDHDVVVQQVARLEIGLIDDSGTNIAAPIASAVMRLKDSEAKRRVAVLFTDGQNTVPEKITPLQAADIAADFDIICHTVGIGSNNAYALVQTPFGGRQWVQQPGSYDEATLRDIAERTKGTFFEARDADGFREAMAAIDALEKSSIELTRYIDYMELFVPWVLAGLILLGLAFLLEQTLLVKVP